MQSQITDTELDNITHLANSAMVAHGVNLSDDALAELNEVLHSFLTERCALELVPDPLRRPTEETFAKRNVSVRCEWKTYGYIHVEATSFSDAVEKVLGVQGTMEGVLPGEQNIIEGSFRATVDREDNLNE